MITILRRRFVFKKMQKNKDMFLYKLLYKIPYYYNINKFSRSGYEQDFI